MPVTAVEESAVSTAAVVPSATATAVEEAAVEKVVAPADANALPMEVVGPMGTGAPMGIGTLTATVTVTVPEIAAAVKEVAVEQTVSPDATAPGPPTASVAEVS